MWQRLFVIFVIIMVATLEIIDVIENRIYSKIFDK